MNQPELDSKTLKIVLRSQENELTEHFLYKKLAQVIQGEQNTTILNAIADDELKHHDFWMSFTNRKVKARKWDIFKYYWITRLFGLTFGLRLMEKGEQNAQVSYELLKEKIPNIQQVIDDENRHEQELISILKEDKLEYVGSVVLGLNDALVELTGTLAGLTFALQNNKMIALVGLITGIAASMSMAASEYLSQKHEENDQSPVKSALYTGIAYVGAVIVLIAPYFILSNHYHSLAWSLINAVLIIFFFNFYISVAKNLNFKQRFAEMTFISLGVAALSFIVGYLVRTYLGVDL